MNFDPGLNQLGFGDRNFSREQFTIDNRKRSVLSLIFSMDMRHFVAFVIEAYR